MREYASKIEKLYLSQDDKTEDLAPEVGSRNAANM